MPHGDQQDEQDQDDEEEGEEAVKEPAEWCYEPAVGAGAGIIVAASSRRSSGSPWRRSWR
jgi:hypothetical protein